MTLAELKEQLSTTGYQVGYEGFLTAPSYPCIAYYVKGSQNFFADGQVYKKIEEVKVQLYTETKDLVAEATIELALSNIKWEKTEEYIKDEKLYLIEYTITIDN